MTNDTSPSALSDIARLYFHLRHQGWTPEAARGLAAAGGMSGDAGLSLAMFRLARPAKRTSERGPSEAQIEAKMVALAAEAQITGPTFMGDRPAPIIDDLTARRIASDWHSGGGSALCGLSTSGAIHAGTAGEIISNMPDDDDDDMAELESLLAYVNAHGVRGRQAGWSDLSW